MRPAHASSSPHTGQCIACTRRYSTTSVGHIELPQEQQHTINPRHNEKGTSITMPKITFMGAGSTVFAKAVCGDCMMTPSIEGSCIALYDVDPQRLDDSRMMLQNLNRNLGSKTTVEAYLGIENRRAALDGADYVVNAIQVGGYEPSTVIDFEIPKKYGLLQTIGDTLGIGGIFRSLRTIPVVLDFCRDIEDVCPDALFINYVNPMAMITGAILQASNVRAIGLCHSVQGCVAHLLSSLDFDGDGVHWEIAGINHQAWVLTVTDRDHNDLYPLIRQKALEKNAGEKHHNMVRLELMRLFGYYVTESSEHTAEYMPYWIKRNYPELIDRYNIPLDEYPRRCINQIERWKRMRGDLVSDKEIVHKRSHEYASTIINAIETDTPARVHGNVLNTGLITNLPARATVEVPCLIDRNGVNPCVVGDIPEQCAALNRTNINVQLLTIDAVVQRRKQLVYQAALLDPHTSAELSADDIISMCDDLFEAHGDMIPIMS